MRLDLRLAPVPEAVPSARRALERVGDVDPKALQDLKLLVSELVTNSVRHAGLSAEQEIELRVDVTEDRIRVEVRDAGRGLDAQVHPRPAEPATEVEGWGLRLVEKVSDRWGVTTQGTTTVWFELDTDRRFSS